MKTSDLAFSSRFISFVIPVYNEEATIVPLFEKISNVVKENQVGFFEVIFVDDGSRDGSWENIAALVKHFPGIVRGVKFRKNFGKAQALSTGFHLVRGEVIFTMDADLQDDPQEIPNFLNKLNEGFDLVSGWKFKRHDPLSKTLPSRLFNAVARAMSGMTLHDFNCGFKVYRVDVLKAIKVYGELHRYIPILAHHEGFRVGEMVVNHLPRKHGKSKYGLERYIRGFLDLLTVIAITRYLRRPGHLFGGVGLAFAAIGGGILFYLTLVWFSGHHIGTRPLLSFGIMMTIMGVQFISLGLIAELLVRNSESQAGDTQVTEKIGFNPVS